MPLPPVPSRRDAIVGNDGAISVTRWDGVQDLCVALILPTRPQQTAGYEPFASALAVHGISVVLPDEPPSPSEDGLAAVESLVTGIRNEGGSVLVLIGHGLGGLVAAGYLESERRQPDLAVLMSPELAGWDERPLGERLRSLLGRSSPVGREVTAAGVMQHLDRVRVPFRVDHGAGGDVRRDTGWIERLRVHPMTKPPWSYITPMASRDLPNEPGLKDHVGIIGRWILGRAHDLFPDKVPPLPDGMEWARLSRAEATAAFEAFVDSQENRLARFARAVAARGGPELGTSRDDMARLGAWLLDVVEIRAQHDAGDLPDWAQVPYGTVRRLSTESLWLIDGAALHVAAALRTLDPGLEWRLCTQKIDAYYHRPLLEPIHLAPPIPVAGGVISQLEAQDPNPDWLAGYWDAWTDTVRRVREGRVGVDDDPLPLEEVAVDEYDHPRWNAQIWIPEGAEAVLGPRRFARLAERVSRLKGVQDLAWEDREVMLVRLAEDVEHDDLRKRVVQVLRRARRAADAEDTDGEDP